MSNGLNKLGQRGAEASQSAAGELKECARPRHQMVHTHRPATLRSSAELSSASRKGKCDFEGIGGWGVDGGGGADVMCSYRGFGGSLVRGWNDESRIMKTEVQ